jgi:acetyl-CoA carboxylase carboxyl transferase subunit beta
MREKGVPFITVLANPSTGEAYASFANLADIIIAEPNALMGLVPLRTLKEMSRHPLPSDAHTAESHLRNGLVDMLVDRELLHERLADLLRVLEPDRNHVLNKRKASKMAVELPTYEHTEEAIELARHPLRPTARDYIENILDDFTELHGDRTSSDDSTVIAGLGLIQGESVMVIGQQRPMGTPSNGNGHMFPEGFRKARRFMDLAAKFRVPLITFIDTPGAYPGLEAEEQGIGNSIASTLSLMADLPTPIIAVIIGEGGGEGALALGVADRILMLENSIFTPMSPERVAERLYRDSAKVHEAAHVLKLSAQDCLELGIVEGVIPEPQDGAHSDLEASAKFIEQALVRELGYLVNRSTKKLVKERRDKFRKMGEFSTHFKEAVKEEVSLLQNVVLRGVRRRRSEKKQPVEESGSSD